jgi:glycosyltransferase involved in cell wall biosynthesis
MPAKITLLMPCYNGLKYIKQAIASVIAQSLVDWRLIISDDGSKDGTVEYLQALSDERITVHIQPRNLGIFGNLNFLFSCAKSPITQILCQDDFLIGPDALHKILAIWNDLPADIAFLRCNHGCDGKSGLMALERDLLPALIEPQDSDLYFFVFGCLPGNLSNVSVRTELIEQMGWYRTDLPYAGDFEFWSRVGRVRPWALSKSHVVQVRRHAEQASATLNKRGELLPQMWLIVRGLFERLRAQGHDLLDLRVYATTNYVVRHMDAGLRDGLKGRGWGYMKLVNQLFLGNERFLGKGASWFIYLISGGARFFLSTMAKRLIISRRKASVRQAEEGQRNEVL